MAKTKPKTPKRAAPHNHVFGGGKLKQQLDALADGASPGLIAADWPAAQQAEPKSRHDHHALEVAHAFARAAHANADALKANAEALTRAVANLTGGLPF